MTDLVKAITRAMAVAAVAGALFLPMMVSQARASGSCGANNLKCSNSTDCGSVVIEFVKGIDRTTKKLVCLEEFVQMPAGTIELQKMVAMSDCGSSSTNATPLRDLLIKPAFAASPLDLLIKPAYAQAGTTCTTNGTAGSCKGYCPEMSGTLALAYIVVTSGMIYFFRRRALGAKA